MVLRNVAGGWNEGSAAAAGVTNLTTRRRKARGAPAGWAPHMVERLTCRLAGMTPVIAIN